MRLLIIDDEEDICDTIAEIARDRGFEVETTSRPETVADKLQEFKPEIIMLDLMMPGTDGVELLRVLVDHVKDVKICLMSGSDSRVLNGARRLGSAHGLNVVAALEKPLEIAVLRKTFDELSGAPAGGASGSDIGTALAMGQLVLYFQPVVEIKTRRIKGAEALIRWQHPTRGVLLPAEFLDQLAADGLMPSLTEHVISAAIDQAAKWHKAGENMTLSVNLTASSLLELTLPDRIAEMCKQRGVPPERLILEVTETEAMSDVTKTMDVLLRMRIRNIGVSIDDFGTGHSSLRELQRMPFSEMKIDKGFVVDMATNKDAAVIVNSIIDLGHNLGLKIIAEGVEDQRIWQLLADKGCDFAQGYLMSKALTSEDFDVWAKAWREKSPS